MFHQRMAVCPDIQLYMQLYSCSYTADDVTIWKETAIDCQERNSIITLIHRRFMSPGGTSRDCNDGAIVARSIGFEDSQYSSVTQLNVTVTNEMPLERPS